MYPIFGYLSKFRKWDTHFEFLEKKKEEEFIGKIKIINREPYGSIQEELLEYKKAKAFFNYLKLTATKIKEKEYISKVVNYATELNLLTILKNNNLISDEDFFKIKNKIMLQYGIKSELMIWWDISTYGIMMMNLVNNFKKLGGRNE